MKMMKGVTRTVFLIDGLAIKVSRCSSHMHFLQGCCSNYSERDFYRMFKDYDGKVRFQDLVAPSYFCSVFGLVQIQKRCSPNFRELSDDEVELFRSFGISEFKPCNFGYIGSRLVCLDYA